jgi:hypothetical protein
MRHAVGEREEGGDRADIPDVLGAEAVFFQLAPIVLRHGFRRFREFHGEIEHCLLALGDIGLAMIDCDLVAPGTLPNDGKVIEDVRKYG